MNSIIDDMEFATTAVSWALWITLAIFAVVAVWFILDALTPQRIIDRARKNRGIDLLANVVDRPVFFRFLRIQKLTQSVSLLLLIVVLAVLGDQLIGDARSSIDEIRKEKKEHVEKFQKGK